MRILLLLAISTCIHTFVFGQELFNKNHDNSSTRAHALLATSDSMYIQAGVDNSENLFIYKSNRFGDTLWLKTYGGSLADEAIDIAEASSGGYVIVGNTESFGAGGRDIIIIRIDEQGSILWSKTYGKPTDDEVYNILKTSDNGYLISAKGSLNNSTGLLLKIDANGILQWEKTYSNIELTIGNNVIETSDNGLILVGKETSGDLKIIKLDNSGQYLWARSAAASWQVDLQGVGVIEMSNGDYVVFGDESAARINIFVIRFDPTGTLVWGKAFRQSSSSFDHIMDAMEAPDGGIILSTIFEMEKGLAKLNGSGSLEWAWYYWNLETTGSNHKYKGKLVNNWVNGYAFSSNTEAGLISTDSLGRVACYGGTEEILQNTSINTLAIASSSHSTATITTTDITTLSNGNHSMSLFEMNSNPVFSNSVTPDDCTGTGSISLSPSGGYAPYSANWNTGCTGLTCANLASGSYSVELIDAAGCVSTSETIVVPHEATTNEICLVSIDSNSQFVQIMWETPAVGHIEGYNIYRNDFGIYNLIGSRDYDSTHIYIDTQVQPNQTHYRYKISVLDSCGYESAQSVDHQTVFCAVQAATSSSTTIEWTDYEGTNIDYYRIYRDDLGTGNWQLIDSVNAPITSYTDNYYNANGQYRVEANTGFTCMAGGSSYNGSLSNSASVQELGLSEESIRVSIWPNPAGESLNVSYESSKGPINLTIMSLTGQKIVSLWNVNKEAVMNISELSPGMYQLVIDGTDQRLVKKFVKN
ncbi:MAG: T9SS type A sorting domain-containing protein [Crocinitomicaceae bacterium]|nr:T9SS type A sorting domain-containing protein [Flavobacteriales bacterium]NQZ36160.1 T9SS type A sorting domain-containing protein [Crocinitomicaceae bacterium]